MYDSVVCCKDLYKKPVVFQEPKMPELSPARPPSHPLVITQKSGTHVPTDKRSSVMTKSAKVVKALKHACKKEEVYILLALCLAWENLHDLLLVYHESTGLLHRINMCLIIVCLQQPPRLMGVVVKGVLPPDDTELEFNELHSVIEAQEGAS